jgi:protein TonB
VAFVSAARKPVFKKCGDSNKGREEKCTADRIFRYLSSRFVYPKEAEAKSIQGSIVVSFVVERDGSITEVKALNDIGGGCAQEAVRLIKSLPKFKPGLNAKGNPIRVKYTQPVTFKLEK